MFLKPGGNMNLLIEKIDQISLKDIAPKASKFYIRLGFSKITDNDKVTHWIDL
jgi:hypothetical protein